MEKRQGAETMARSRGGRSLGWVWVVAAIGILCLLSWAWWWGFREKGQPLAAAEQQQHPSSDRLAFELSDISHMAGVSEESRPVAQENDNEQATVIKKQIALTFDDGPHPRYTPVILDILKEYGVHATFFMVGENVKYYHEVAEAVEAAGHEIGNHTYSHARLDRMSKEAIEEQICACEDEIASLNEYRSKFFRPPEGQMSDAVKQVSQEWDYRLVLWDVDTRDWAHTPPDVICEKVLTTIQAGDIILMHDFIGKNSPTPEALRLLIPALLEKGYEFVTVGELMGGE